MKAFPVLLAIITYSLSSQAQVKDTAKHVNLDTITVSAQPVSTVYRATEPTIWDINNIKIALSFNWKERTADAKEWIRLHPHFYPTDTLQLDAKAMRIDMVQLVNEKGSIKLKYTYEHDKLILHFDQQYKKEDTIELYLKYTAMPYSVSGEGSKAITEDRGLYFINTDNSITNKPSEIWTQGETEANSHWMICIDKPNSRFTTQVELTVPEVYTTLSNGELLRQSKDAKNMRTDVWRMNQPIQAYAVMFAIGKFKVIKDEWKEKEVSYYVEPEYAPYARQMFKYTPEMIDYFSQRTGVSYPWNKYSQVVVRDYVSGAMENTSASLFGEFMNQTARESADKNTNDVVSHELFHQWFGDYVTAESWSNLTLNESFANYGEQLWRSHKFGKASADELADNDLQKYLDVTRYKDPQLVRFYYNDREEMFDPISYNKGGAILRYLNNLIGDAAFDRAMNIYLTRNALRPAEAHNWRMAVEEATGMDWNWFFNQWYYHAGHPVLTVTYIYNDNEQKVKVAVSQSQGSSDFLYHLPLKAAIMYGRNKTIVDWNIEKKNDTFVYEYRRGAKPIIIPDCMHVLPGEIKDGKNPEQWKMQFILSDDYISKRMALTAAGKQLSDSNAIKTLDLALNDGYVGLRIAALTRLKKALNDNYHQKWPDMATDLAANDTSKLVRAEAFSVIGEWGLKMAKPVIMRGLADSSYAVAGAALEALGKIDKEEAYVQAKELLKTGPRGALENAVWAALAQKGADDDIELFEAQAPVVFGAKKFLFAQHLGAYLKNVKNVVSFSRGVDVYKMLITKESIKNMRAALVDLLFQVAKEQKDNLNDKKEDATIARKHLDIVKGALQTLMAIESDADILKDYQKSMKELE